MDTEADQHIHSRLSEISAGVEPASKIQQSKYPVIQHSISRPFHYSRIPTASPTLQLRFENEYVISWGHQIPDQFNIIVLEDVVDIEIH